MSDPKQPLGAMLTKPVTKEEYSYPGMKFEVVDQGGGTFIVHIFGGESNRLHPAMHERMRNAIRASVDSNFEVSPNGVDFKIEWVPIMDSYCISMVNIHNVMWRELFKIFTEGVYNGFSAK